MADLNDWVAHAQAVTDDIHLSGRVGDLLLVEADLLLLAERVRGAVARLAGVTAERDRLAESAAAYMAEDRRLRFRLAEVLTELDEFRRNAKADVELLLGRLVERTVERDRLAAAIEDLDPLIEHRPFADIPSQCRECLNTWPCPTERAHIAAAVTQPKVGAGDDGDPGRVHAADLVGEGPHDARDPHSGAAEGTLPAPKDTRCPRGTCPSCDNDRTEEDT